MEKKTIRTTTTTQQGKKPITKTIETKSQTTFRKENQGIFNLVTSLSTYIIVMLVIVLGGTTLFYNDNKENLTWLNDDNTFDENSYDLYRSYGLNTPLDDLNGFSIKQVFEEENLVLNGDFSNGLNNWNVQFQSQTNINVVNDRLSFNGLFPSDSLRGQDIVFNTGNEYYVIWNSSKVHTANNDFDVVFANYGSFGGAVRYSSVAGTNSLIRNAGTNGIRLFFQVRNTPRTIDISFDDVYVIDLDDLGINQTKDEMDFWYSEYQTLKNEVDLDVYKQLGNIPVSNYETLGQVITSVVETMDAFLTGWIDFYETILSIF